MLVRHDRYCSNIATEFSTVYMNIEIVNDIFKIKRHATHWISKCRNEQTHKDLRKGEGINISHGKSIFGEIDVKDWFGKQRNIHFQYISLDFQLFP